MKQLATRPLVVAALTTLLSACSADQSPEDALAEQVLLTQSDLGTGWEVERPDQGGSGDTDLPFSEDCQQFGDLFASADTAVGTASGSFSHPTQLGVQQVSVTVAVFADAPAAQAALAPFGDERLPGCTADAFRAATETEAADGFMVNDVTAEFEPPPQLGDASASLKSQATVTSGPLSLPFLFDVVAVREDRVVMGLFVFSAGEPLGEGEQQRLLGIMVDRVEG